MWKALPPFVDHCPKGFPWPSPPSVPSADLGAWVACGDRLRSLQGGSEVRLGIPNEFNPRGSGNHGKSPDFFFKKVVAATGKLFFNSGKSPAFSIAFCMFTMEGVSPQVVKHIDFDGFRNSNGDG